MITIKTFSCNMLAENCYVVSDETHEAVIIDCGALYEEEGKAGCHAQADGTRYGEDA